MNQQPQPGPVLGLPEKPSFFQSPSPPPAVHHNVYTQNAQHTSWTTHSPSPPPLNQFGTPLPGSPPPNGSFSQMSHNIARPPSAFQSGGTNNPLSLAQPHMSSVQIRPENNTVAEEGNMSVSIDFGVCSLSFQCTLLNLLKELRSPAWSVTCIIYTFRDLSEDITGLWFISDSWWANPTDLKLARLGRNI